MRLQESVEELVERKVKKRTEEIFKRIDKRINDLKEILKDEIVMKAMNVDERTVKACIFELKMIKKEFLGDGK